MTHVESSQDDAHLDRLDEDILARSGDALAAKAAQARKQSSEIRAEAARASARSRAAIRTAQTAMRAATDAFAPAENAHVVLLLQEDRDLASAVPAAELGLARERSAARTTVLARSRWSPHLFTRPAGADWLGLYVLDGALMRRVRTGAGTGGEILGAGDVVRPWDEDGPYDPLPVSIAWVVLAPARVAILDGAFARRMARWPGVVSTLMARLNMRSQQLTRRHVARTFPRVDLRLLITLWFLAERWGTVGPEGAVLALPLTHQMLATLVGAQRPSTTLALDALRRRGWVLRQTSGRWVITHDAIAHLAQLGEVAALLES